MTPDQFIAQVKKGSIAPAFLFLGPETYLRPSCRRALVEAMLPPEERDSGHCRFDLDETPLAAVIDDALALTLFNPRRVLWAANAEAVLPKGRAGKEDSGEAGPRASVLTAYLARPNPGAVIVFDSSRYEFEGEDKARAERVRQFFAPVGQIVEFPRWRTSETRRLAQELARREGLRISPQELDLLVEAVGGLPGRVAAEIEKLRLYLGPEGAVTPELLRQLVPQAQETTIFALVNALGRNDPVQALALLDILLRSGEYLPLALSFLATQFRQALVAQETGLRTAAQIQTFFSRAGVPMWPSKAEQILQTVTRFQPAELRRALKKIAAADVALRDIRPDDRVVMERFVMTLTA